MLLSRASLAILRSVHPGLHGTWSHPRKKIRRSISCLGKTTASISASWGTNGEVSPQDMPSRGMIEFLCAITDHPLCVG